jgi:hypothetical protein
VNRDEIRQQLEDLNGAKLTKWETEFVESLTEQYDEGHNFSGRQLEILNEIYEKHVR